MAPRPRPARQPAPRRTATGRQVPAVSRRPAQDRGQKRVEGILDAAERLIAKAGTDAITTNAIAAEAGAGVGSLYHFFPNKDAIIAALADRYRHDLLDLAKVMLEPEMATVPIAEMAARIVRPMAAYLERRPAYLPVYRATMGPGSPKGCHEELHRNVVAIVERLMKARSKRWPPEAVHVSATAIVEVVHRLLEYAQELKPRDRAAMITETARLVALHAAMVEGGVDPL